MMLLLLLGLVGTAFAQGQGGDLGMVTGVFSDDVCSTSVTSDGGGDVDYFCGAYTCDNDGFVQEGTTCDDSGDFCTVTVMLDLTLGSEMLLTGACCGILQDDSFGVCTDAGYAGLYYMTSITGCDEVDTSEDSCSFFGGGSGCGMGSSEWETRNGDSDDAPMVVEPISDDQSGVTVTIKSFDSMETCEDGTSTPVESEVLNLYMGCQSVVEEGFTMSMSVECVDGEDKVTKSMYLTGDCSGDPMDGESEVIENGGCNEDFEHVSWTGFNCVTGEPEGEPEGEGEGSDEPEGEGEGSDEPEGEAEDDGESPAVALSTMVAFVCGLAVYNLL